MNHLDPIDILLVEDSPHDVELTIWALKRHNLANHLFVVGDGEDALDFIFCRAAYKDRNIDHPPKVVLLDLKLPKLNGLEVLQAIKTDERTRSIPVIIVTSSREAPDIKAAYDLGVNGYVVKPVQFDAFMDVMSRLGFYWLLVNEVPE